MGYSSLARASVSHTGHPSSKTAECGQCTEEICLILYIIFSTCICNKFQSVAKYSEMFWGVMDYSQFYVVNINLRQNKIQK